MKPIKIRVRNQKHSEMIQKMLFAVGYHWGSNTQLVQQYNESFLYGSDDGTITHSTEGEDDYFDRHPHTEVDLDWLIPERETIEIDGFGKFYKDEVEECLDRLKRVE